MLDKINKFYFANEGIETVELQKYEITSAKINQIRLREPLEIQIIQPEKYLKYTSEFGYAGHMLPILISYKVIHQTLTY